MEEIKLLREKTGAGMVDCKKALEEAGGDIEMAIEILRKKGIAKAAKRTDRETAEGVIKVGLKNGHSYMVQISAETDFVARNEKFQAMADSILQAAMDADAADLEAVLSLSLDSATVKESLDTLSGTIGEKMELKAYVKLEGASVAAYSHMGGRIGVLVALDQTGREETAYDIAMQVAAANPKCVDPSEVEPELIAKEKEIYAEQLRQEGKPEAMMEKILEGKIKSFYNEICLVKQDFIKDDKKKVEGILAGAKVTRFYRFSL